MSPQNKIQIFLSGIVFCLVFSFLTSCEKDAPIVLSSTPPPVNNTSDADTTDTTTTPPIVLPDSIFYFDITDTTLQSVSYYTASWNCSRPNPSDSVSYYDLDITGDGLSDVKLSTSTSYTFVSASNPCSNYSFVINCGTESTDGAVTLTSGMINPLATGDTIDSTNLYRPGGSALKVSMPGMGFSWPSNTDAYIGLKITRNGVTMYGWLLVSIGGSYNSITIKSFAINKRNGNDIFAGQTN